MPDAAKHRQYLVIASSFLALVLVCFLASADVHASPLTGIEKQVDLEHGVAPDKLVTHWAARREVKCTEPLQETPLDAQGGSDPVALWFSDEAGLSLEFVCVLLVAGKPTILSYRLDNLAAPRAPPAVIGSLAGA